MSAPTNLQSEWARIVVTTLADAGVTTAVLSPGSRSTPYVLALSREPRIDVQAVLDERVAGFAALGVARVTRRPVLLLCTSGSALAHYLPAVVEASEAGLPLVVLSADRPPELHDASANQTIRQHGIYGTFARWSVDLGVPEPDLRVLRGLRRRVLQAVRAAHEEKPGPVHLNAPARKPLEPPRTLGPAEQELAATADALLDGAVVAGETPCRQASAPMLATFTEAVAAARGRGLVACGPDAAAADGVREAVLAFARTTGFPILAEGASGLRFCGPLDAEVRRIGAVDALLRAGAGSATLRPEIVLQVGAPLVASGWEPLAARPGLRWVVAPWGWPDPDGSAVAVVQAEPGAFLDAVRERLAGRTMVRDEGFGRAWQELDDAAFEAAAAVLREEGDRLSEGAAVRELVARLPDGALLGVGNSLPVRHLDAWAAPSDRRLRVLVQRGASGIDGLVAGAIGAHRAARRPGALVVGDVSFVHDLGALATAPADGPPLVVVVLDNGGGRIFEQLPIATVAPELLAHFVTPPRVDLGLAAAAFGRPHACCDRVSTFAAAVEAALARAGSSVVQARVPPHGAAELAARVAERMAALVRSGAT